VARIADLLGDGPTFSFEFFPPKNDEEQARLEATIKDLEPLHPSFVSVTYRGGRSSRERTTAVVLDILRTTAITAMPHLVCVAHSREELTEIVDNFIGAEVDNLLALGGDPVADEPAGSPSWSSWPGPGAAPASASPPTRPAIPAPPTWPATAATWRPSSPLPTSRSPSSSSTPTSGSGSATSWRTSASTSR